MYFILDSNEISQLCVAKYIRQTLSSEEEERRKKKKEKKRRKEEKQIKKFLMKLKPSLAVC